MRNHLMTDDAVKLYRDYGVIGRNFIELGAFARASDPAFKRLYLRRIVSLRNVVDYYLHRELSKDPATRSSDWGTTLSDEQKECT
jgi:hypothetical protein